MISGTWFEAGLLDRYSVNTMLTVLDSFGFNAVVVMPFPTLSEQVQQLIERTAKLNILKFLVVGSGSYVDFSVVDRYQNMGYVMTVDDGTPEVYTSVKLLKDAGYRTAVVHGYDSSVRRLFNDGLVDFSMPCYYPVYPDQDSEANIAKWDIWLQEMRSWCTSGMMYLPWIQCFGKANQNWLFPSADQVRRIVDSAKNARSDGVLFFEPFSGQSTRGEIFEGFLDHREMWGVLGGSSANPLLPLIIAGASLAALRLR